MAEKVVEEIIEDHPMDPEGPEGWSQVWQMPVLLLGLAMVALGVYWAMPQPEENQFTEALHEVALYLKARNLDEAQAMLNEHLEPFIDQAPALDVATYYLMWADLVYLQQEVHQWDKRENHERVLGYYKKAEDGGLSLGPTQLQRLAETYVALSRDSEAMGVLDRLRDAPASRRYMVVRRIIERRRRRGDTAHDLAPLMTRFDNELREETDQAVRREQEIWSIGMQAKGLLDVGEPERSIGYLQRQMIGLMAAGGDDDLGPLRVLLAKAFQRTGEFDEAKRWYRLARQKLEESDPLNASVLVGLAQIDLASGEGVRAALENFSVAESEYPLAPAYIEALIGRADCEARLGAHSEAREHFGQAVKMVVKDLHWKQDKFGILVDPIHAHFDLNSGRQDYTQALDYLNLLKPLYREQMPAKLILEFAQMYEQIAEEQLKEFVQEDSDTTGGLGDFKEDLPTPPAAKLAMQEAAVNYAKAGDFYYSHAQAVTGYDDEGFGQSLWAAAVSFDKAQLWDRAIEVYAEFVKARPEDPRQLRAVYHLGLAYQSSGQYKSALALLQQLVTEHKNTPEAYRSLVPLARCHVALNEFDSAERVLLHVMTNHPAITPESLQYKQALIELGKLYYQEGRYEQAAARLAEAVDRYGETRLGPGLRFRLADAYRLSVHAINKSLEEGLPESQKSSMRAERVRRLELAGTLFNQSISELESLDAAMQLPIEKLYVRNAFFYRADCAYDLGKYEQAIMLYDLAAKRWEAHPASLVALVQIVNAYCEMGRTQEAKVANDRARWQLQRIPDEAFDDPTLPMTREHWQDWLRWTSELNLFGSQANAVDTGL